MAAGGFAVYGVLFVLADGAELADWVLGGAVGFGVFGDGQIPS